MSTTDNAPDSNRDGGGEPYEDFFDEARMMVRLPQPLFEELTTSRGLLDLRDLLKVWFLTYIHEHGACYTDRSDLKFFWELDDFLSELVQPVLHREFLKSHNIKTDSKQ